MSAMRWNAALLIDGFTADGCELYYTVLEKRTEACMGTSMDKFVEGQNVARFTTLLMTETDTAKRELLQSLLTDEMVRQARHSDAKPHSPQTK